MGVADNVAAWLVDTVPAGGSVGPFQYSATATAPTVGANHAWLRWLAPGDSSTVSANVRADYPLISMKAVSVRSGNTEA